MYKALLLLVVLCYTVMAAPIAVRIRFGLTDTAPASWNGSVSVTSGDLVNLRLWHPRPDLSVDGTRFRLSTKRGPNFRVPPPKPVQPLTDPKVFLVIPGVVLEMDANSATRVRFNTPKGAFTFDVERVRKGEELSFLGGAVVVDYTATTEQVSTPDYEDEQAAIHVGPDGQVRLAWVGWREGGGGNHVFVRRLDGAIEEVTNGASDAFGAKLAHDREGNVWVIWSDQKDGNRDLYARSIGAAETSRLTEAPGPDVYHEVTTDADGNIWLVWHGFRNGQAEILARMYDGRIWQPEQLVSTSPANDWNPAIAADSKGAVYVAWDSFDKGNYDIALRRYANGEWSAVTPIAGTAKFEAHVSLTCDKDDRLWAAWNESGTLWGKDTGYGLYTQGTRLYAWRSIQVAVQGPNGWLEPTAAFDDSLPTELRGYNDFPKLHTDDDGRIWAFFRHRTLRIRDVYSAHEAHRASWEIYGTSFNGSDWSRPINIPNSRGRMDMRGGFASDGAGNLYAAFPTDNRNFAYMLHEHADVWFGRVPTPPTLVTTPKLKRRLQPKLRVYPIHPNEAEDTARIRDYTIESSGKRYKIYRGDTHRHTEFSMDGHNDGSLLETYRYAMDPGALDYLAVTEHNFIGGPEIPYINWLLQQMVDAFFVPGKFATIHAYERSVRYPNGHRNILFAKRGNPTFKISKEEQGGRNFAFTSDATMAWSANPEPVGTKDLYRYLKKYNGISIPHTPTTGMGTDWRDNDPDVEPLVEIYQGDRISAEYEGAPRTAYTGHPRSAPGGFRPKGFLWNAWAKGYKLGVQASSDHLSTHISYSCTIAEEFTREGLLDAMRKRHNYAATDNIILDYRLQAGGQEYLQGDIVTVPRDFKLWVNVIGTTPIRQIDIIRNETFVHTRQHLPQRTTFTFQDTEPLNGETYYYVRVQQIDGQIAWSSPIWVIAR